MRSLIAVISAATLMTGTLIIMSTTGVIAGDQEWRQEMRRACYENQSGRARSDCYHRYNVAPIPEFSYNDNYGWQDRPRRYKDRSWRRYQQRRYIESNDFVPNHDGIGLIVTFGQFAIIFK